MPAIKAYKGLGHLIPVDDAKIIKAYQCPWTNKVFDTKKAYLNHLKVLRETRMHFQARQNILQARIADLNNQPSVNGIVEWVRANSSFFFDNISSAGRTNWSNRRAHLRDNYCIDITYLNIYWSETVSNSHSCPRSGVTNFSRTDDKPKSYPGWQGNIEFTTSIEFGYSSENFRSTGIHTGSGGGGKNYQYDVKLFAADWPAMAAIIAEKKQLYNEHRVLNALIDKRTDPFTDKSTYGTSRFCK